MLLTEEQASTKWCPHSRYNSNGELASNRWKQSLPEDQPHALNPVPCRCIASECMAWRIGAAERETVWNFHDAPAIQRLTEPGLPYHSYQGGWQYLHTDMDHHGRKFDLLHRIADTDTVRGFCGLAGKVE